jgi:hypothetical protein
MKLGSLGDIVFQVSDSVVETLNNLVWSGNASYSTHQRHLNNALTEMTGIEPDSLSFDMELSLYAGVQPMTELVKIWNYERAGTALSFVLGSRTYGKYRWNIVSHKATVLTYDKKGDPTRISVSLVLQEYLKS